jgi:hypothetical protein
MKLREEQALSEVVVTKNLGWGARIRTWEWRNQNLLPDVDLITLFLPTEEKSERDRSKGYQKSPNPIIAPPQGQRSVKE